MNITHELYLTVDLHGMLELDTDADGWSYAMDFETFSNSKCYYERGAACRRRRWTRTVSLLCMCIY